MSTFGSAKLDADILSPAPVEGPGEFSKGLRSGALSMESQLKSLAGGIGGALGYQDFAAERNAAAQRTAQEAQAIAPRVGSYRDVTSLRDAGDYVAGLGGQAIPSVGLGVGASALVAATGGGAIPALVAGAATQLPFETGDVLQRQQLDPTAKLRGAGENLRDAVLTGGASAVGQAIVPAALGGKLVGKGVQGVLRGAEREAVKSTATGIGKATLKDALVEGASEGGGELVKQQGVGFGNAPDWQAAADNAVGGAIVGGGMGTIGGVADAAHANKNNAIDAVKSVAERGTAAIKNAAQRTETPVDTTVDEGGKDFAGLADNIKNVSADAYKAAVAKGTEYVERFKKAGTPRDTTADAVETDSPLAGLSPEEQSQVADTNTPVERITQLLNQGGAKAKEWATKAADTLSKREDLAPEIRQRAAQVAAGAGDAASTAWVATQEKAVQAKDAFKSKVDGLGEQIKKIKDSAPLGKVRDTLSLKKKSEDFTGVREAIAQDLTPLVDPDIAPEQMSQLAEHVREFMDIASQPNNSVALERAANSIRSVLGGDPDAVDSALLNIYTKVGLEDPRAIQQFATNLQGTRAGYDSERKLVSTVMGALPDNLKDKAQDYADTLLDWARGEGDVAVGGAVNQLRNQSVRAQIKKDLGAKTDAVLDAVQKHLGKEQLRSTSGYGVADSLESDEGGDVNPNEAPPEDSQQLFANQYTKEGKKPVPMQNPDIQDARAPEGQVGATRKLLDKLTAKYPNSEVRWVSQFEETGNGSKEHGFVKVTDAPKEGELLDSDWRAARLDTEKQSKDAKGVSRIDVPLGSKDPTVYGLKSTDSTLILDAVKVARAGMDANRKTKASAGETDAQRLARGFFEGVAQITDQFGAAPAIKGSTVIGTVGGEPFTAAMAKKLDLRTERDEKTDNARKDYQAEIDDLRLAYKDEKNPDQKARIREKAEGIISKMQDEQAEGVLAGDRSDDNTVSLAEELLSGDGRYEIGTDTDVVTAAAVDGSKIAVQGERGELRGKGANGKPWMLAASELEDVSPAGKSVAAKINRLAAKENINLLSAKDRDIITNLLKGEPAVSEVAPVINKMIEKYADRLVRDNRGGEKVQLPDGTWTTRPTRTGAAEAKTSTKRSVLGKDDPDFANSETPELTIKKFRDAEEEATIKPIEGETENERALREQFGSAPRPKARAAQVAALDQAASSSDPALINELNTTENISGLARTAEYLAQNHPDTEAARVAAENFDLAIQNPDTAYSLQRANGQTTGPVDRRGVMDYLKRVLGNSVALEWKNIPHAGEFDSDILGDVIRISVHALNPKSVAYHESLHAFFKQLRENSGAQVAAVLEKAASQKHVIDQMNAYFKNEPAVLKQIKGDREEAAAYMYQLWAQGDLKLNPQATTIFQKVAKFIRDVLGIWSNDQRALHIMEHFNSGEYAKNIGRPNVTALLAPGTNRAVETAKQLFKPATDLGSTVFAAGGARLRDTGNAALIKLADAIKPMTTDGKDPGFLVASRNERAVRMNALANDLMDAKPADLQTATRLLQEGGSSSNTEVQSIVETVKKHLQDAKTYLDGAKVQMGDLGPDYFPRVWDPSIITGKQAEFLAMVDKYVQAGLYQGDPQVLLNQLIANDGNNFAVDTRVPGFQQGKTRELDFITGPDAQPFLSPDLYKTMNSYMSQATRRAEFARRFGEDGRGLDALLSQARQQGANEQQLKIAEQYIKGVTGTLGDDISPTARRLMGNVLVYQNLRLLPLAIFSSIVDPLGIAVRGGTVGEAWGAFKRGVSEIPKGFKGEGTKDWQTELAETLGVIDNASLLNAVGALHTQGMVGDTARKINDTLFKFNLMEQYNRSMRVAATETALKFIQRHATSDPQSVRFLDELGLTGRDVRTDPATGRLRVTEADGLSAAQAQKMRDAVNKWVDGAVLRPDAADRPIWFNDPRFMLISHLKSFVYSFHHTIIDRVVHEAQQGNYKPLAVMGSYVPIMIAADYMKGFIQGGGEQPAWKKDWGAADYVWSGVQRGGLLGVGQFGVDVVNDIQRGGAGLGAVTGPTLDQLIDGVQVAGGKGRFETLALDAMPANALYGAVVR